MQPTESIDVINQRLVDYFGKFDDKPKWRIVFSEDQYENRLGTYNDYTREGIFLREVTEVRLVPKYKQWIHKKWVLEKLVEVPEVCQDEILSRLSYEPIWVFEDKKGNPLPPIWIAIEYLITSVEGKRGVKLEEPNGNLEERIKRLEEYLFGDENAVTDSLAYREGVFIKGNGEDKHGTGILGTKQSKDN